MLFRSVSQSRYTREMVYWANETHDSIVFDTAKGKMIGYVDMNKKLVKENGNVKEGL